MSMSRQDHAFRMVVSLALADLVVELLGIDGSFEPDSVIVGRRRIFYDLGGSSSSISISIRSSAVAVTKATRTTTIALTCVCGSLVRSFSSSSWWSSCIYCYSRIGFLQRTAFGSNGMR